MPNRMLRDWTDSYAVNELDAGGERLFTRLIMKADDYGRFHADPRLIRSACFPLKDEVRDTDISRWLAACQKAGLIRCYAGPLGREYLEIVGFNQRLRLKKPRFPAPPSNDGHVTDTCPPEVEDEVEVEEKRIRSVGVAVAPPAPAISDVQWLGLLKADAAYEGIDVDREHAKMVRWCEANHKKPSRRRFINWLNRVERPMKALSNGSGAYRQDPVGREPIKPKLI